MSLLLLAWSACTAAGDKPTESSNVETGDSVGGDSPSDSRDSGSDTATDSDSGGETGNPDSTSHTADTADSSGTVDSADSADTGPHDTGTPEWAPGDDIPGWEDADSSETAGARAYTTVFPDLFRFSGEFSVPASPAGPQYMQIIVRDCVLYPCDASSYDEAAPYARADLDATWGDAPESRGVGIWGPDATDPRHLSAIGYGPLESWSDGTTGSFATVTVCISRSRPDRVEGAIRAEVGEAFSSVSTLTSLYSSIIYRLPFTIALDDHAGFNATAPDALYAKPAGFDAAHFTYDIPYDDAWPWDDTTDPAIRTQVYERYLPYNTP